MDFKFAEISESDLFNRKDRKILSKPFSAKVSSVEEKTKKDGRQFYSFVLNQSTTKRRTSKILALAFGDIKELVKNVLKPSRKRSIQFPSETFSCRPKDKSYDSPSTCEYDLYFEFKSKFIWDARSVPNTSRAGSTNDKSCSLKEVLKTLVKTKGVIERKLKSVQFSGGIIYRYLGCEKCYSRISRAHSDGKYYCTGTICNNGKLRKGRIGVTTQRKICFTIYDLEISDGTGETITSVVIYTRMCEKLLQKNGCDFNTDEAVVEAWQKLVAGNRFDITIKRKKKERGSSYVPSIIVNGVDSVVQQDAATEMNDAHDVVHEGPWPNFDKFEMKLQQTPESYEHQRKYPINSKPPGLVLLINNNYFPNYPEAKRERIGSEIDIDLLYRGFVEMGYKIFRNECQMNIKTKLEFKMLIEDFQYELLTEEVDSVFIIISSHGVNHGIELTEGEHINVVEELMIPFSDEYFCEYQGKPKIFMPIVCQNWGSWDCRVSLDNQANLLFDMLVCFPALPGYAHYRVENKGTLYVHLLMQNLMKYAMTWNFVEILEKVQYDMKEQIIDNGLTQWTVCHYNRCVFGTFHLIP